MKTLQEIFEEKVAGLEARARDAGTTVYKVCKEVGVARATYDRWRREAPKSIKLMTALESGLDAAASAHALRQGDR